VLAGGDDTVTSVTLFAQWVENADYTVAYDVNGGTSGAIDSLTGVAWTATGLLPASNPSRTGYAFTGWQTAGGAAVTGETAYSVLAEGDDETESVTLVAQWVENDDYVVNYDLNYVGAASGGSKSGVSWTGTGLLPVEVPKRVGYRFVGWTVASDAGSAPVSGDTAYAVLAGGVEVESVSVFAQWSNLNIDTYGDGDFGVFMGSGDRQASVDAPYNRFVELLLENDVVAVSNYTVVEGSTVITLQESYLVTFTNGTYWFTAVFDNGVSHIKLVVDVPADVNVPAGGKTVTTITSLLLTITSLLSVTSLGVFCVLTEHKRRLQQAH
jgi:uncharacterized repeat protein (TIGR02543 family)